MVFETVTVRKEGAVLFADIAARPMNLLGPELIRDLVSLIQQADADSKMAPGAEKDATADYADEFMHAALVTNLPNYASAIVTTNEAVRSIFSVKPSEMTAP